MVFIRQTVSAQLYSHDLLASLSTMDVNFMKAGFNDETKFDFLRNAIIRHQDIAQFTWFRSPKTYADLKIVSKGFVDEHVAIISHFPITQAPTITAPLRSISRPPSHSQDVQRVYEDVK